MPNHRLKSLYDTDGELTVSPLEAKAFELADTRTSVFTHANMLAQKLWEAEVPLNTSYQYRRTPLEWLRYQALRACGIPQPTEPVQRAWFVSSVYGGPKSRGNPRYAATDIFVLVPYQNGNSVHGALMRLYDIWKDSDHRDFKAIGWTRHTWADNPKQLIDQAEAIARNSVTDLGLQRMGARDVLDSWLRQERTLDDKLNDMDKGLATSTEAA